MKKSSSREFDCVVNLNYDFPQATMSITNFVVLSLKVFQQKTAIFTKQFLWSNYFLATQETRSLSITFTFFLSLILGIISAVLSWHFALFLNCVFFLLFLKFENI